jgi:hypothetical protein
VNERMQTWLQFARRNALGALLMVAALCFGAIGAWAATPGNTHTKSHTARKSSLASKTRKASVRNVAYKTPVHRRRRRRIRHHVILPKAPSAERTQEIQDALQRGGYYSGDPTGKWDASTQESLRRFQAANGLPPTGKLDALSLQKMGLGSNVAGVSAPRPVTPDNTTGNSPAAAPAATPKTPGA